MINPKDSSELKIKRRTMVARLATSLSKLLVREAIFNVPFQLLLKMMREMKSGSNNTYSKIIIYLTEIMSLSGNKIESGNI